MRPLVQAQKEFSRLNVVQDAETPKASTSKHREGDATPVRKLCLVNNSRSEPSTACGWILSK